MNPEETTVSHTPSATTPIETSSFETVTSLPTCPMDHDKSLCQFSKAENEILKTQLKNCKSSSSDHAPPSLTDSSSSNPNTATHVYIWFGFFVGFFVGCLFVIFLKSATYKKMKNICCHKEKTVEEREREMNGLGKKKEKRNDNKKEEKKKEENSIPNERKVKKEEDLSWENKNNLKKELNQKKPPLRQKKNKHTSINLIDLNAKEEKTVGVEEMPEEKNKIMVDSVAIVIENV